MQSLMYTCSLQKWEALHKEQRDCNSQGSVRACIMDQRKYSRNGERSRGNMGLIQGTGASESVTSPDKFSCENHTEKKNGGGGWGMGRG